MKSACLDLRHHGEHEHGSKDGGGHKVAQMHGHGNRVTPRFAQRGGGDFDDPEKQGNFRDLAESLVCGGVHGG